jgi:hypothetical protein
MIAQSVDAPPGNATRQTFILPALTWGLLIALALLAVLELKPPDPVPASAPLTEFSSERALVHLRVISRVPHPLGSAANTAVREYLMAQLASMGLNPQVFQGIGVSNGRRRIAIANTHDIVGRLPGTANSKAFMLVAHYDSVSTGPGAGDDGAAVASILETVRALRSGPALKNDLIVLFTDGEEASLLGADAFAFSHPWLKETGLILNFEGRGDRGPSLLFETSAGNAALIDAVSRTAPHAIGSSLFAALYRKLPNDTDFTVFNKSGVPGLNFAFGENLDAYHSRLDTVENLSPGSLQHHGSWALSLSRHFGQQDLTSLKRGGDDVFFDLLGSSFVSYSQGWVLPGEILVSALLLGVIITGVRRSDARASRVLLGVLLSVVLLLLIPVVLAALAWLVTRILGGRLITGDSAANTWLLAGFALLGVSAGIALLVALTRRFSVYELSLSGLIVVDVLSWALALTLAGASYLLFWPLLLMTLGALAATLRKPVTPQSCGLTNLPAAALMVVLFAPLVYLVYVFFTMHWITMAIVGLLIGLCCVLCSPALAVAVPAGRSSLTMVVLVAAGFIGLGTGAGLSHSSAGHPRHDSMFYSLNADTHGAAWISLDRSADGWTSQFFSDGRAKYQPMPDYLAGVQRPVLSAAATELNLAAPVAEIQSDEKDGAFRRIRMNVRSPRKADAILLTFGDHVRVVSVRIGTREIVANPNSGYFRVSLLAMEASGADLELRLEASSGVSFWLEDQSFALPDGIRPRSENFMAEEGSDATLVCRKYSL